MKYIHHRFFVHGIVFVVYLLFVLYVTFPLILHLGNFATGYGDEYLIAWIMDWDLHALFTNPLHIFSANIYYPYTNSLAYSDTHFISALLAVPFVVFIKQPVVVINSTLITSLLFLAFSMYFLGRYLIKSTEIAFVIGVLIMFCPVVLDKRVHLQILAIEWVPIALLLFIHFLRTKRLGYLSLSLSCFVIQTYNSFMPGYFILFSYVFLCTFYAFANKKNIKKFFKIQFIFPFIIAFLLLLPVVIPYYHVANEFNFRRDIREAIHLALQPEDFFYPAQTTRLAQPLLFLQHVESVSKNAETKPGYLGFMLTIVTICSFFYLIRKWKSVPWEIKSFFAIAVFGLVMSLGPALHLHRQTIHAPFLIPLPYALFYYIIPGFQGIRNSARWEMLFVIGILVVIAYVLHEMSAKLKPTIYYASILVIALLSIVEFNFPLPYVSIETTQQIPKVDFWLATTPPNTAVIELPIYNWYIAPYVLHENQREFYSTVDFRNTVNGASGFSPPPWQKMVTTLWKTFPSDMAVGQFKAMGITYIIIHKNEFDQVSSAKVEDSGYHLVSGDKVLQYCNTTKLLTLTKQFGNDYVYKIK